MSNTTPFSVLINIINLNDYKLVKVTNRVEPPALRHKHFTMVAAGFSKQKQF